MTESRLQHVIIGWLKDQGAYVIKTKPQPGIPVGCPDVVALYKDKWCVIEVKNSPTAAFRPGQEATLNFLRSMNPARVFTVFPENWDDVQANLIVHFFY